MARQLKFSFNGFTMDAHSIYNNHTALQQVFQNNLKSEISTAAIESLFSSRYRKKVVTDPYYQRNYVWNPEKATYFIESIFLGTEIPPLVFYKSDKIEVIDGKQRYETIEKFLNGDLKLSLKGLSTLKYLANKTWKDLDDLHTNLFLDTNLRVIEFSIISDKTDEDIEDKVKKEIFRRYNSGITPLKAVEVEKAKYIDNNVNNHFKKEFKADINLYKKFIHIFMGMEVDATMPYKHIELALKKVRQYMIISSLPITYFANSKKDIQEKYFRLISEDQSDIMQLFENFKHHISFIENIKNILGINERLAYECLYWILDILEKEGVSFDKFTNEFIDNDLREFFNENINYYDLELSHYYKNTINRYEVMGKFFENKFSLQDISIYIYSGKNAKTLQLSSEVVKKLPEARTQRPNATDISIDSLIRKMQRQNFLIRPAYQRLEVINKQKSSSIIESILLDIKLPAIFVHKRDDDVLEVVDGQQRLLSILGYIGEGYLDEVGKKCYSNKNKFALTKLSLLENLNGKKFNDLSEDLMDKIYEYKLSIVEISADINPDFDPIDLFIRLNQKPYPIKENSFEMLNSYIDKDVIRSIKEKTAQYKDWFHFHSKDKRMINEELFSSLLFLNYTQKHAQKSRFSFLDVYQRSANVNVRLKDKNAITNFLKKCTNDTKHKANVLNSIKDTEKFINKLELILLDKDIESKGEKNVYLESELGILFNLKKGRSARKAIQNYYLLWLSISEIQLNVVKKRRSELKKDLSELFVFFRNPEEKSTVENIKDLLMNKITNIRTKYSIDIRKIKLTDDEVKSFIKTQNNICPICDGPLYFGDSIHVDHTLPLIENGKDSKENLQVTHSSCNLEKGGKKNYKI